MQQTLYTIAFLIYPKMAAKKVKEINVSTILKSFKANIFAIEYYFKKFGDIAAGEDAEGVKKKKEHFIELVNKFASKKGSNSSATTGTFTFSADSLTEMMNMFTKQPKISNQNFDILSKSAFLMLNNYFEYLLTDLMSYYYGKFRDVLNEKKMQATLKEMSEFDSMNDFVKYMITKEVEAMIVEMSFEDLREHFEKKLGINNEESIVCWNVIVECRERRHLIVHNSSLVNKKYLIRSGNPFALAIGDKIQVNKDYFFKSCNEFLLAGLLLSYNCWGKWDKETTSMAITEIMQESFDLLKANEFELAARFTTYLNKMSPKNENEEDTLLRARINRLIALKKIDSKQEFDKEIKLIKIGTASPIFKLAFAILTDKHTEVVKLIEQSKALNEIDIYKYQEWPIYSFVRDIPELNKVIEQKLSINDSTKVVVKKTSRPRKTSKNG